MITLGCRWHPTAPASPPLPWCVCISITASKASLFFRIKWFLHRFSGFLACDDVSSTLKGLAACASLQSIFLRSNSNSQTVAWICKQWNYWYHNILWKTRNSLIRKTFPFFESLCSNWNIFKGAHKTNEFIPGSENIVIKDEWYFAVADYVSVENCDVNIKVIHRNGPVAQFLGLVVRKIGGSQYMISLQK